MARLLHRPWHDWTHRDPVPRHAGHWHPPEWINLAVLVASLWLALALATAIYDVGRWLSAW